MVALALTFVFGAFCLQQMPVLPALHLAWSIVPLIVLNVWLSSSRQRFFSAWKYPTQLISSFLAGFFWAAVIAALRLSDALPVAWENRSIEIIGVVASVSELNERGERFRFDLEQVLTPKAVVPQHISLSYYPAGSWNQPLSTASRAAHFKPGERWRLTVRLKRPHGTQNDYGPDFEAWALAENIRATGTVRTKAENRKLQDMVWLPHYMVEHVRATIQQDIMHVLANKAYSGIIQALVMGDDSQIAANDWQLLLRTGTSHLMSISGLHITMLSGLIFALTAFCWRRYPGLVNRLPARKAATLAGAMAALMYAFVAGFSVPTQRTLYMLLMFAAALWSGRQLVISQVLALALFVVVLLDPWAVIAPGFWLSFGAMAILSFILAARISQPHWFKAACQTQWAVTIGMLPLLLLMFNQVSLISPLANAIAIPLISFVVTPLALAGSFLSLDFLLVLSYHALELCMSLLEQFNALPEAVWQQHAPPLWTLLPALMGVVWLLMPRGTPMRWIGGMGLMPMLLIAPDRPAIGNMKVSVLDVGQGLSVVVQTASHTLLYDTGPKYSEQVDAGARIVIPFLRGEGIRHLDGMIISHNDSDHSGGMLSILSQLPVSWMASSMPQTVMQRNGTPQVRCFSGQHWVWDDVRFDMVYPGPEMYQDDTFGDNNRSCVIKITSRSGSILLTGDIELAAERWLIEQAGNSTDAKTLKSDVIIVPHHGSKTSSSAEFVNMVQAKHAIFTVGYLNRFKHPRPEVLNRYENAPSEILRTDYHGAITLSFLDEYTQGTVKRSVLNVTSMRKQRPRYWHDVY